MSQLKVIIDLCIYDENDQMHRASDYEDELLEGMDKAFDELFVCSLDYVWFERKDINDKVFVIDDGGDLILLKDGTLVNICWRGDQCRVWKEDGRSSKARYIKKLLRKAVCDFGVII